MFLKSFHFWQSLNPNRSVEKQYLAGGMGYGHAKQALFELMVEKFKTEREKFNYYQDHPEEVEVALAKGAVKASKIADEVLLRVRRKAGVLDPFKKLAGQGFYTSFHLQF